MGVRSAVAIVAAALSLCACTTMSAASIARAHPPQLAVIPSPALPSPEPETCGYWTQTYADLTAAYGEIRNCFPVDAERSVWVITTLGNPRTNGVIALYYCAAAACRDGSTDHPTNGWHVYVAPFNGGVTVLGQPLPTVLTIDNGGRQIEFDLTTDRYLTSPG